MEVHWLSVVNAAIYSILGIAVFALSFALLDRLTPYDLWHEIVHNRNTALAILLGAMSIGICLIIASAVH
jgi:putative membrane protein